MKTLIVVFAANVAHNRAMHRIIYEETIDLPAVNPEETAPIAAPAEAQPYEPDDSAQVAYTGLLGVIKYTEPGEYSHTPAEIAPAEPTNRQQRTRSEAANTDAPLRTDIGAYLAKIGETDLLNAAQEVELAKRIEGGLVAAEALRRYEVQLSETEVEELTWLAEDGRQAKDHLMRANLRLVVSLARKHRVPDGMTLNDLFQEGNLGLNRAVEKFDYTKGYKFSTYSTWWIRQAVQRGIANQGETVRKPVHVVEDIRKLRGIERGLEAEHSEVTPELLAEKMQCDVDHIFDLLEWRKEAVSLDQPLGNGHDKRFEAGATLLDIIGQEQTTPDGLTTFETLEQRDELLRSIDLLSPRSRDIIIARYGLRSGQQKTFVEIGKEYELTPERTRQIAQEALRQLQRLMRRRDDQASA